MRTHRFVLDLLSDKPLGDGCLGGPAIVGGRLRVGGGGGWETRTGLGPSLLSCPPSWVGGGGGGGTLDSGGSGGSVDSGGGGETLDNGQGDGTTKIVGDGESADACGNGRETNGDGTTDSGDDGGTMIAHVCSKPLKNGK